MSLPLGRPWHPHTAFPFPPLHPPLFSPLTQSQSTSLPTLAHLHDSQSPYVQEPGQTGTNHLESGAGGKVSGCLRGSLPGARCLSCNFLLCQLLKLLGSHPCPHLCVCVCVCVFGVGVCVSVCGRVPVGMWVDWWHVGAEAENGVVGVRDLEPQLSTLVCAHGCQTVWLLCCPSSLLILSLSSACSVSGTPAGQCRWTPYPCILWRRQRWERPRPPW